MCTFISGMSKKCSVLARKMACANCDVTKKKNGACPDLFLFTFFLLFPIPFPVFSTGPFSHSEILFIYFCILYSTVCLVSTQGQCWLFALNLRPYLKYLNPQLAIVYNRSRIEGSSLSENNRVLPTNWIFRFCSSFVTDCGIKWDKYKMLKNLC